MRTPSIEIIFRNTERSAAAEEFAREQVERLLAPFDEADARWVTVEALPRRRDDTGCCIRIELADVPGIAARAEHSSPEPSDRGS